MKREYEIKRLDGKEGAEITPKGLALIAAIQNGLAEEVEGGYNVDKFNRFWEQIEDDLFKNGREYVEHHVKMFYEKRSGGS